MVDGTSRSCSLTKINIVYLMSVSCVMIVKKFVSYICTEFVVVIMNHNAVSDAVIITDVHKEALCIVRD